MGQLTCVALVVICQLYYVVETTHGIQGKTDREKNPDILKEFRTFADTVMPQGGTKREVVNVTEAVEDVSSGDEDEDEDISNQNEEIAKLAKDSKDGVNVIALMPPGQPAAAIQATTDTNASAQSAAARPAEALSTAKPLPNATNVSQYANNFQQNPMAVPAGSPLATKDTPEPITGITMHQPVASNPPEAVSDNSQAKKKEKPKTSSKAKSKNTSVVKPPAAAAVNATTVNEKTKKPSETLKNYQDDDVDTYIDAKAEKPKKNVKTDATKKKQPIHKHRHARKNHVKHHSRYKIYSESHRGKKHHRFSHRVYYHRSESHRGKKHHRFSHRVHYHRIKESVANDSKTQGVNERQRPFKQSNAPIKESVANDIKTQGVNERQKPFKQSNAPKSVTNGSKTQGIKEHQKPLRQSNTPKNVGKLKDEKRLKTVIKPQVYVYAEPHQPQPEEHHIAKTRTESVTASAANITPDDLKKLGPPWNCDDFGCKSKAGRPSPPSPPSSPESSYVCMTGCPGECAPICTPQCCSAQETAPPPDKEPEPLKQDMEKRVRWMERAHYEPGPNYPPPPIPPQVIQKVIPPKNQQCAPTCARSCAPGCLPTCCPRPRPRPALRPAPPPPQVVGCSRNCTPRTCVMGCPLHCCARYIKKSKVVTAYKANKKAQLKKV